MPELKARAGSSKSVRGCIAYLTRDGRALASDFINCSEIDELGRPVWKQMDGTRCAASNDKPDNAHGGARPRTFEHFILSPDPRDDISLTDLRKLAVGWAQKYFGDYEVAIFYHNDNMGNIPHAHIVVNNTNLKDGSRLAPRMVAGLYRSMDCDLQEIARSLGLRAFERNDWRKESGEIEETTQKAARTIEERSIIASGGYSWKEDIRQRMVCAVKLSRTPTEFLVSCGTLGLEVRGDKKGEWIYSIAGHETWQVKGKRLGFDYSRFGIERWVARDDLSGRRKIGREAANRMRAAIAPMAAAGAPTPLVLGMIDGEKYTVMDVSDMLDLCEDFDIRSMDDFHDASARPMAAEARERLRSSWRLARSLGHLPEHRQRMDGKRLARMTSSSRPDHMERDEPMTIGGSNPERVNVEMEER